MNRGREGLLGRHQQAHDERGHIEHVDRRRDRIRRGRGWRHHRPRAPERLVLMTAFAAVVDALFADPNIGCEAVYTSEGGAPALVRIVSGQADAITDFGDALLWSETTRIDLRVAEVANPHPGDRIEIDGDAFLIQGEPVRDRERLVWAVDLSLKLDIAPDLVAAMAAE